MTRITPSSATLPVLPLGALIHPQPGKRPWHANIDMAARRTVLLHILVLLRAKYSKVDAKISYIARRAELALYSQAFTAAEYGNPQTLSRRLRALVVKLQMHNLAAREDDAFAAELVQLELLLVDDALSVLATARATAIDRESMNESTRKRQRTTDNHSTAAKRQRTASAVPAATTSRLFFDGNDDLLHHVSSFLNARDVLRCSATCTFARRVLPAFVTTVDVSLQAFAALALAHRAQFFTMFPHVERVAVRGCASQMQQIDPPSSAAFVARNVVVRSLLVSLRLAPLLKLQHLRLDFVYTDGLYDRITCDVAAVLFATHCSRDGLAQLQFPLLQTLSLRGNSIADDGVAYLCEALTQRNAAAAAAVRTNRRLTSSVRLRELNVEHNCIGERGFVQLKDTVALCARRGQSLVVRMRDNLVAVGDD